MTVSLSDKVARRAREEMLALLSGDGTSIPNLDFRGRLARIVECLIGASSGQEGDGAAAQEARLWGETLAGSGDPVDLAVSAIWECCNRVSQVLAEELRSRPQESSEVLKEWAARGGRAVSFLIQGYTMKREELATREREDLLWMAVHDGLTGLYNHRFFDARISQEFARAQRHGHNLSVLMLDVDHFKLYNDTCGHLQGNEVLKKLAATVSEEIRTSDFVARFGGEEYVVILPETNPSGALVVAERIREAIERLEFPGMEGQPLGRITVSLGSSTFPPDASGAVELIRAADKALYEAKRLGRNRSVAYADFLVGQEER